ncbi:hypothetical protein [Murimonas intestini]|uniref:O-antigen ligase domain-containing protein n=1 Tax=Murimonas intestini TaxID=1337051 RepID=A0AB73T5I4_9FIRM|nr:hypothetical protein [Murimonas intestini]MCR1840681.1 hypothetical protein [Murimonas intestini]MCR1865266.1 hypothetical protein [Murimonas intestini]MCR1883030.1 hypothetical protein [Murimonas intestini]
MIVSNKDINKWIFDFLMVFLFFSGVVEHYSIWHMLILIGAAVLIIANSSLRKLDLPTFVILFLGISLFIISSVQVLDFSIISSNLRSSLYSISTLVIMVLLVSNDQEAIRTRIEGRIKLFNVFYILNLLVLYVQEKGTGQFIKASWLAENGYYPDQCAGLFGFNATNVLALYSIFVLSLNLFYAYSRMKNETKKKFFIFYTLASQGVMVIMSQYNDNVGYYIELVVFAVFYALTVFFKEPDYRSKILHIIKYLVLFILIILVAFSIPTLREFIEDTVQKRLVRGFSYKSIGAYGSNERLAIVDYAIHKKSTWLFGLGIGAAKWVESDVFGFAHFGISSMGSYILLSGLWFYLVYVIGYSYGCYKIIFSDHKNRFAVYLVLVGLVIFLSNYTALFNNARITFLLMLIIATAKMTVDTKITKET